MQITLTMEFDLESAAGRQLFARFQQLVAAPAPELPASPVTLDLGPGVDDQILPPAELDDRAAQIKLNRQAAAAKARAAKTKPGPVEKVLGPVDDLNGAGPEEEDIGLVPEASSMSPGEARDAGLALVRQAYAAGHVAPVKALQKKWQIAKFYDIPVEQGHVFYQEAVTLAQGVGMQA